MCSGCSINLFTLFEIVSEDERLKDLLFDHKLLRESIQCPTCSSEIFFNPSNHYKCGKVVKKTHGKGYTKRHCKFKVSAYKGTFFEKAKLSRQEIFHLMYLFINRRHSYKVVEFETKLCPKTIASWFSFMREVCLYYCEENSRILGGPGCIVEIGEAKVGKRKYNKGRIIEGQWVLGGLERNSKKIFLVTIPDRTEETLLEVIRQWIIKGTKIVSNCWSSYRKLTLDGYTQESVNNCLNIVNPESGESTQSIEWLKGDDQDIVPKFGREEEQFEGHLATAIFQKIFPDLAERFHHFLLATAALYPPTNEFRIDPAAEKIASHVTEATSGAAV